MTEREQVVVMELTRGDIEEIHRAVRDRSAALGKEAKKLRELGRHGEADALEATVTDLNTRLATQFAAELDHDAPAAPTGDGEAPR